MVETLGLKNINMLSKDTYDGIMEPDKGELYVISGSGFGFPSSRYIDLELGASGTEYVAPANGWVSCIKYSSASNQHLDVSAKGKVGCKNTSPLSNDAIRCTCPVEKGDVFVVSYTAGGSVMHFRFIYAEGEN
jgi:hypothetical protein